MIRTLDPHVPNVVRYQTALHSVTSGASIDQRFSLHKQGIAKSREKVETFVTGPRIALIFLGLRDRSDRTKVRLIVAKELLRGSTRRVPLPRSHRSEISSIGRIHPFRA